MGVNVKKKEVSLEKKTFVVLFLKFTAMRCADMTKFAFVMPLKIWLFDPLSKEINSYKRIKPTQGGCQCKIKRAFT